MSILLMIGSLLYNGIKVIQERLEPEIPAENWANKDLMHRDIMDCVPHEKIMENIKNGRYIISEDLIQKRRELTSILKKYAEEKKC